MESNFDFDTLAELTKELSKSVAKNSNDQTQKILTLLTKR